MTPPGSVGLGAFAELVRLPAALSVPGDSLAGMAASGAVVTPRTLVLPAASACLYWAGMSLNDWADRDLDAVERPERPIPSGRVPASTALALAGGLTGAGVVLAAVGGGLPALRVAAALAGAVWTYDLVAKDGVLGPVSMASTRVLDVLLGSAGSPVAALPAAATVGTHTVAVTGLSRGEVHGTRSAVAAAALAGTVASTVAALLPLRHRRDPWSVGVALLAAGTYAWQVGRAQWRAVGDPSAANARSATGTGVRAMIPLQATLVAAHGAPARAVGLLLAGPVVRRAARWVSPT